jgi:hypothetical protein
VKPKIKDRDPQPARAEDRFEHEQKIKVEFDIQCRIVSGVPVVIRERGAINPLSSKLEGIRLS